MSETGLPALFNDGKAADAFRTIGEVAQALGIRQHVLRYWEEQVPALRPVKRSGGRRYYRPEDVALLQTIDRLVHREGYTLRGARQAIEAGALPAVELPASSMAATALPAEPQTGAEIQAELRAIRQELSDALKAG
ncbi:MAG: MerR family transcriptional regulator [Sphingomonadales bacterium]|nr:MerR family transcriptional regulator [Sphingomonadales bacterium]